MTKEELAKKKGLKTQTTTQTAAESLILSKQDKKEDEKDNKKERKTAETKQNRAEVKDATIKPAKTANKEELVVTPSETSNDRNVSKAGRPKGRPYSRISINVPEEYLDLMNIAAGIATKGNLSSYVVSLIEKDIEANDVYKQIWSMTHK